MSKRAKLGDNSQVTQFVEWYSKLVKKDGKNPPVRFFKRFQGDLYSTYGEDATVAADFFNTTQVIKHMGPHNNRVSFVDVRRVRFASICQTLLTESKRSIELWDKSKATGNWEVISKASPGNTQSFEDILRTQRSSAVLTDANNIMSLDITTVGDELLVGVTFVDSTDRKIAVCQFLDTDNVDKLEAVLISRGATECLLYDDKQRPAAMKNVKMILSRMDILMSELKRSDFKGDQIEENLGRLVGDIHRHHETLNKKNSMRALSAVIKNLDKQSRILTDDASLGKWSLEAFEVDTSVRLNDSASKALNLFPQPSDPTTSSSLYGLLNKCRTSMGSRRLASFLKQPLMDIDEIELRHDLVELFVTESLLRESLRDEFLGKVPDLARISRKFSRRKATLQDVVGLYFFASSVLPRLLTKLIDYSGPLVTRLDEQFRTPLKAIERDFGNVVAMVEQVIDLEAVKNHDYIVRADYNDELATMASDKERALQRLERIRQKVAEDLNSDKVKAEYVQPIGYHLTVLKSNVKRWNTKKYHVFKTQKQLTRFTNDAFSAGAKTLENAMKAYEAAQSSIVEKCIEIAATFCPVIDRACSVIGFLDVMCAFAFASVNGSEPYVRPEVLPKGSGILRMKDSRHPCVEATNSHFISNPVDMERGKSHFQIITGPNMGGKSTYIRQIGVITIMAQIGCFVPCSSATITVVDAILARVGASDSQGKGLSTFMAEMLETATILKSSSKDSLVIVDELGRGTSTYDGFGLAWAISEEIADKIGCFAMFATHFHELTDLPNTIKGVVNKHVSALTTNADITMLYRVKDGACDRSFGIHVAELTSFPKSVVECARAKAAELEKFGDVAIPATAQHDDNKMDTSGDDSPQPSSSSTSSSSTSGDDSSNTTEAQDAERLAAEFLEKFKALGSGDDMSDGADGEDEEFLQKSRQLVDEYAPRLAANPLARQMIPSVSG